MVAELVAVRRGADVEAGWTPPARAGRAASTFAEGEPVSETQVDPAMAPDPTEARS